MGQKGDLGFEKCESSFEDLVEAVNLRYIYRDGARIFHSGSWDPHI